MPYYEVMVADSKFHGDKPLTYSHAEKLKPGAVVTVPLRARLVTGFVDREVKKPSFTTKPIKALMSQQVVPKHLLELAKWLSQYWAAGLGDSLRQIAPSRPVVRRVGHVAEIAQTGLLQLELDKPLTSDQKKALNFIRSSKSTTILLHGETGSGKTRVYLELARETLSNSKSVILLTPEIALTSQLAASVEQELSHPTFVLHSQLGSAQRKRIWLAILEAEKPLVVIGPRSALFSPIRSPGLIVVDEAHEPAYKQEQSPRYHASRVASQLGNLCGAKVVLGTATPQVSDYFLAKSRGAVVRMAQKAASGSTKNDQVISEIVDSRQRQNFSNSPYIADRLIDAISTTLSAKKQVMLYLNRRGTARLILCRKCGWQMLCPSCDIPLVYHGDHHQVRCHTCGYISAPPLACPQCRNSELIYRSMGTKALVANVAKLFAGFRIGRFDSDSASGERLHEIYGKLRRGEIDILVGTQLLAKGLDLPKLGLVGVVSAESSLALPDYTAGERTYQLTRQVIGRVGRGHSRSQVIVQSYEPDSLILQTAIAGNYNQFYENILKERRQFRFPPYVYLLKLTVRRKTIDGASASAGKLKNSLQGLAQKNKMRVEIIGPSPSFYSRRGDNYYWQLVVKSKDRNHLVRIARLVPADWSIDLDPSDLL